MGNFYDGFGNVMVISGGASGISKTTLTDGGYSVLAIAHRGYSGTAPENTLPAYKLAKENGFNYAECDVAFTSDGVAVLLHNASINATARNADGSELSETVNIADITYEQALNYDFGIWKGSEYAGTPIPTLEEFLGLCKKLGLHPYIELKRGFTQERMNTVVEMVKAHGLEGRVTYISGYASMLTYLKNADPYARVGVVSSTITADTIALVQGLMTGYNTVFLDANKSSVTDETVAMCIEADIPLEIWTVNDSDTITALNPYITGVTSDSLVAGKVLYEANI